jgi:hypothetical protein
MSGIFWHIPGHIRNMSTHFPYQHLEPCQTRYRGFSRYRVTHWHDIGSYVPISGFSFDPISGHVACDPISGTYIGYLPDIGSSCHRYRKPHTVNHIPDIGINIGYNIRCPDIGDIISRYRCQYRVPISGVPISGYDSHRYRSEYRTRCRVLFLVPTMRSLCKAVVSYSERKIWSTEKNKVLMLCLFLHLEPRRGI